VFLADLSSFLSGRTCKVIGNIATIEEICSIWPWVPSQNVGMSFHFVAKRQWTWGICRELSRTRPIRYRASKQMV
jgi:hypothetical protein